MNHKPCDNKNGTSVEWSISQVEVKCDVCTLDNALENSYESHLLGQGTLPINYNTYINQSQNVSGQTDIAINVSRAISRLKSVFFNFSKLLNLGKTLHKMELVEQLMPHMMGVY